MASVPLMITRDMKQQLLDLGWTKAEIVLMTPEEAHARLKLGVSKAGIEANVRMAKEGIIDPGGIEVSRINPETGLREEFVTSRITATPKAVNPDKVQVQLEEPHLEDTKVRHKVETLKQQDVKQQPAQRMDQRTRRKAAARKARAVKDTNLDAIQLKTNTAQDRKENARHSETLSKQDKVVQEAKANADVQSEPISATEKAYKEQAEKIKDKPKGRVGIKNSRARRRIRARQLGPFKGGGWKLFEKDVAGMYKRSSRFMNRLAKESKVGEIAAKIFKQGWARKTIAGLGITLAVNLGLGAVKRAFPQPRVIPEDYERGYDVMSEYLTDFGSPLNLAKAAHKVLRPYYSSVRSSLRTNVNTIINNNVALKAHKYAIGHTRY